MPTTPCSETNNAEALEPIVVYLQTNYFTYCGLLCRTIKLESWSIDLQYGFNKELFKNGSLNPQKYYLKTYLL